MFSTVNILILTSILMPLFRLARVSNFCSDLVWPLHSIIRILPFEAISFEIFLYALFPRFPWSTLLPFHNYFNFHNLTYLGIDVSTPDMTIALQTALNYHILNLHNNTPYHEEHQLTSY